MREKYALLVFLLVCSLSAYAQSDDRFLIVVDAGSRGTRLHLYSLHYSLGNLLIINELSDPNRLQTGNIDAFAEDPHQAGQQVKPLFALASAMIEKEGGDPKQVSAYFYATAGMRLLEQKNPIKARTIYQSIRLQMQKYFQVKAVRTLSGVWEGIYNWIGINYLLGRLQDPKKTVAALDMGGASTQITYSVESHQAADLIPVRVGHYKYNVLSHSFLGLGQNQAEQNVGFVAACYPQNALPGSETAFVFQPCAMRLTALLDKYHIANAFKHKIEADEQFLGVSGYYYVGDFFGISDKSYPIQALHDQIVAVCSQPYRRIQQQHPQIDPKYLAHYCFQGVYQYVLLTQGYGLSEASTAERYNILNAVTTARGTVIPSWSLGVAVSQGMP